MPPSRADESSTAPSPSAGDAAALRARFESEGYLGPLPVLSRSEANALARRLPLEPAAAWAKGYAASSRAYYDVAALPAILDRVAALIGNDVILWGASLVVRKPGQVHPWHTDMETAGGVGRTVSVWLGLENVNRNSSLQVVPGSHRFGVSIQELAQQQQRARDELDADAVLAWARDRRDDAEVAVADMGDGDAIFFDGRLWHGTDNTNPQGTRVALLLQYATPDRPIRIPDYRRNEMPFRFYDEPRPRCIVVRGRDEHEVNRIASPPDAAESGLSWIHRYELPLADDPERGWNPHKAFRGATPCLSFMTCHASVLSPGASPHPPHSHVEEEILLVLAGEAVLTIGDGESAESRRERVGAGSLVYYPAWQPHTLRNESDDPVTYLMFKWDGPGDEPREQGSGAPLGASLHRPETFAVDADREGWTARPLFEGPTEHLRKLRAHHSTLAPAAGYEPHADAYDVALVVLEGAVETLGERVGPGAVVFYAAGEPHGIRNVGDGVARYLVFEFHGSYTYSGARAEPPRKRRTLLQRIRRRVPEPLRAVVRWGRSRLRGD